VGICKAPAQPSPTPKSGIVVMSCENILILDRLN
jgi:hypothetical protein